MHLPEALLESLEGTPGFDRAPFIAVHESEARVTSVRVNPAKMPPWAYREDQPGSLAEMPVAGRVPWSRFGYYLSERPSFTFDPLFHAGTYYVQEASSMFLEQVLMQHTDPGKPIRVLDLCAAPGGKSTHLQSLISPDSLLVSNEVIRSRVPVLRDNIIKWGAANVMVTSNDPADFSGLEQFFDVIVVDAPCSGSGLFRRDPEAISEWGGQQVQLCSQRQQRILQDVLPALRNGGILVYSTCSYSREEDEAIAEWITEALVLELLSVSIDPESGIVASEGGYRFWPHRLAGEGFFISCFRKPGSGERTSERVRKKPSLCSKQEQEILAEWVRVEDVVLVKHADQAWMWPGELEEAFLVLYDRLRVVYAGTHVGTLVRDKLVPAHALAMSSLANSGLPSLDCDRENAIRFLQRRDLSVTTDQKGWQLVRYGGFTLGWVNVLPNRINNYYPKELRILKDQ